MKIISLLLGITPSSAASDIGGRHSDNTSSPIADVHISDSRLTVSIGGEWPEGASVCVSDDLGRVVRSGDGAEVNLWGLLPGWYIAGVNFNGETCSMKFRID